jgi:hypothetical protein
LASLNEVVEVVSRVNNGFVAFRALGMPQCRRFVGNPHYRWNFGANFPLLRNSPFYSRVRVVLAVAPSYSVHVRGQQWQCAVNPTRDRVFFDQLKLERGYSRVHSRYPLKRGRVVPEPHRLHKGAARQGVPAGSRPARIYRDRPLRTGDLISCDAATGIFQPCRCGCDMLEVIGVGPHCAQLRCVECGRGGQWLSREHFMPEAANSA